MKINVKDVVELNELESGTVFEYLQSYYMLLADTYHYLDATEHGLFAVDLASGKITCIDEEAPVRSYLNAELRV
jgi:hypothetical protein